MKDLKQFKIKDLLSTYLTSEGQQEESTTVADVVLPPDKASTKTKAAKKNKKPNGKGKKLLQDEDGENKRGKSG